MSTISTQVSRKFARQIRIAAAKMDVSKSEFIRAALEEKLAHLGTSVEDVAGEQETRSIANVSEASATDRAGDTLSSERDESITLEGNTR